MAFDLNSIDMGNPQEVAQAVGTELEGLKKQARETGKYDTTQLGLLKDLGEIKGGLVDFRNFVDQQLKNATGEYIPPEPVEEPAVESTQDLINSTLAALGINTTTVKGETEGVAGLPELDEWDNPIGTMYIGGNPDFYNQQENYYTDGVPRLQPADGSDLPPELQISPSSTTAPVVLDDRAIRSAEDQLAEINNTPENVEAVENKLDAGGQLTGRDVEGLTDEQRVTLSRQFAKKNAGLTGDEVEDAVGTEARRGLLDPFSQRGGAEVVGQGNSALTFGRLAQSGLERIVANLTRKIQVDAEQERKAQVDTTNSQYDQATQRLSRFYALQPGQASGAQRKFEEVETNRANALSRIDAELDRSVRDETRTNIQTLMGIQESREAASRDAASLNIEALGLAAGFTTEQERLEFERQKEIGVINGEDTISKLSLVLQEGIAIGEVNDGPTVQMLNQILQEGIATGTVNDQDTLDKLNLALQEGIATGDINGVDTIEKLRLALSEEIERGRLELDTGIAVGTIGGTTVSMASLGIDPADLANVTEATQRGIIEHLFEQETGRKITDEEFGEIMAGREVAGTGGQETVGSQQLSQADRQFLASLGLDESVLALDTEALEQEKTMFDTEQERLDSEGRGFETITIADVLPGVDVDNLTIDDFFTYADQMGGNFQAVTGRDPTDEELRQLFRGGMVQGAKTIGQKQVDIQVKAQKLADKIQNGQLDLAEASLEFDAIVAERGFSQEDRAYFQEKIWGDERLELDKRAMTSQEGAQEFAERMELAEQTGWILDPASGQMQMTLTEKARRKGDELAEAGLTLERDKLNETADQFTRSLRAEFQEQARKYGLDVQQTEAMIAQTYAEIERRDRQVAAETRDLFQQQQIKMRQLNINEAQFAITVEQQTFERAQVYRLAATEHGFNVQKFEEAKDEADRQYMVMSSDIASQNNLDRDSFDEAVRHAKALEGLEGTSLEQAEKAAARRYGLDLMSFRTARKQFNANFNEQKKQLALENGWTQEQFDKAMNKAEDLDTRQEEVWNGLMTSGGTAHELTKNASLNDFEWENTDWGTVKAAADKWIAEFGEMPSSVEEIKKAAEDSGDPSSDYYALSNLHSEVVSLFGGKPNMSDFNRAAASRGSIPKNGFRTISGDWTKDFSDEERAQLFGVMNGGNPYAALQDGDSGGGGGSAWQMVGQIAGQVLPYLLP
tara:strand:- start:1974 stop:5564 length:3591 start_codon:yes stop_codon:yes gene_type:complete